MAQTFSKADIQCVCTVSVFPESPCGLFLDLTFSGNFIKSATIFDLNLMLHQHLLFSLVHCSHINITKLLGTNHNRTFVNLSSGEMLLLSFFFDETCRDVAWVACSAHSQSQVVKLNWENGR